jgi:hypothetical protein
MVLDRIPIYKCDEYPKQHWLVCEIFWDETNIADEDTKMTQFCVALRVGSLTWFMNFINNQQ